MKPVLLAVESLTSEESKPMALLVMILKAATIATIQFGNLDDCELARKAILAGAGGVSTELSAVCVDKVTAAPAVGG